MSTAVQNVADALRAGEVGASTNMGNPVNCTHPGPLVMGFANCGVPATQPQLTGLVGCALSDSLLVTCTL